MELKELEASLEGILFAAGDPVALDKLSGILEVEEETLEHVLADMADSYRFNRRGIRLVRLGDEYQMTSAPELAEYVKKALDIRRVPQLSKAALEVLSIIAYYQPTTRAYIEQIRGVDSFGIVATLEERGLIEECGRLDVPGKPRLFRTTAAFLRSFGIASVEELPMVTDPDGDLDGQMSLDGAEEPVRPEEPVAPVQPEESGLSEGADG